MTTMSTAGRATIITTTSAAILLSAAFAHAREPRSPAEPGYQSYAYAPPGSSLEQNDNNSTGMMYTGAALTITGLTGLGVGSAVFLSYSGQSGDFAGLGALIVGGPILLTSSALLCVGIPLWAVGASEPDDDDRDVAGVSPVPEVRVGVGTASAGWRF